MKDIIFDLDGTLLNTLGDLQTSTNYALGTYGFPLRTKEEVRRFVGNGVEMLIRRALPSSATEEDFARCFAAFREHYAAHCYDTTAPYPGIMPMLRTLKDKGTKLAIVSNKLQLAVTELNERFFGSLVSVAIGEREGVRRKPAPDMVLTAIKELGADICNCVYVGDSDVDIQTARNAGLPCLSVLWGFRSKDFLLEHGATTLISEPAEIINYL